MVTSVMMKSTGLIDSLSCRPHLLPNTQGQWLYPSECRLECTPSVRTTRLSSHKAIAN